MYPDVPYERFVAAWEQRLTMMDEANAAMHAWDATKNATIRSASQQTDWLAVARGTAQPVVPGSQPLVPELEAWAKQKTTEWAKPDPAAAQASVDRWAAQNTAAYEKQRQEEQAKRDLASNAARDAWAAKQSTLPPEGRWNGEEMLAINAQNKASGMPTSQAALERWMLEKNEYEQRTALEARRAAAAQDTSEIRFRRGPSREIDGPGAPKPGTDYYAAPALTDANRPAGYAPYKPPATPNLPSAPTGAFSTGAAPQAAPAAASAPAQQPRPTTLQQQPEVGASQQSGAPQAPTVATRINPGTTPMPNAARGAINTGYGDAARRRLA